MHDSAAFVNFINIFCTVFTAERIKKLALQFSVIVKVIDLYWFEVK